MTAEDERPRTADEARQRNRDLDGKLRALIEQVPEDRLRAEPGGEQWPLAENLAHLGEFPRFFARQIAQMLAADVDVEVGRTEEHPERTEAVAAAEGKDLAELTAAVDVAFDELANELERVSDDDLARLFTNRKYGPEPLATYLQRYVLGHKAEHVDQLRRTLAAVTG